MERICPENCAHDSTVDQIPPPGRLWSESDTSALSPGPVDFQEKAGPVDSQPNESFSDANVRGLARKTKPLHEDA